MATFVHTWTYPLASATRFQDGVVYGWGYQDLINGQANPESKTAFLHRKLTELAISLIKQYEANNAVNTARTNAVSSVDSIGITGA